MIILRNRRERYRSLYPSRIIISVYLLIILTGSFILFLPFSSRNISYIDALFTSTSAFCVTGLIVKDTAVDFSFFGKIIILILIQIGGLGYMVFSNVIGIMLRRRLSLRDLTLTKEEYHIDELGDVRRVIKWIIITTFTVETMGIVILYSQFLGEFNSLLALKHSIFHSVSAFCNAGFSTISSNLTGYYKKPVIPLTIAFLFITGGLGFLTIRDVALRAIGMKKHTYSQTKMVLFITFFLLLTYTIIITGFEWNNTLKDLNISEKILTGFFMASTPRTAGFNLVDVGRFLPVTLFLITIAMYIGASPGGTGGGVKTTTFGAIIFWIISCIKGNEETNFRNRRISQETINRAFLLVSITLSYIVFVIILLLITESDVYYSKGLLPIIFEVFSAFGTVGLSTGSTRNPNLSLSADFTTGGKILIISLMILGRVGALSIVTSIMKRKKEKIKFTVSKMQVG
uniref:Trk family potassium uptake protein n=1 Tax=candidate division WOR-3 bacterium TaxID=2052148 RepID=A0A7C4UG28_UNCW3